MRRLIVTRPEPEATRWVQRFAGQGVTAVALPLIRIAPVERPEALAQAWREVTQYAALMFVSAAAVRHFFAAAPEGRVSAWHGAAWATGPGTAQALASEGLPAARIVQPAADAPQFDSEALWQRVRPGVQPGQRVLIVRGAGSDGEPAGRDWLAQQLEQAGVQVGTVAAYRRDLPRWDPPQQALARQAAADGTVWLFSSSEAIGNLATLVPGQAWRQAACIATHERIAQTAREAGFGVVCLSRPAVDAVVGALESFG